MKLVLVTYGTFIDEEVIRCLRDFALGQGKCLIAPPASISMRFESGVGC
jgi:hypothetical protein